MTELDTKQKDAIWALLAEGGQGKPAKAHEPLMTAGLVRQGYRGKVRMVEVTNDGWHWADQHLGDADATGAKMLAPWLKRIKTYLDAKALAFADLFPDAPEPLGPPPVKPSAKPKAPPKAKVPPEPKTPAKMKSPKPPTQAALRKACLSLTGNRTGERVLLSQLHGTLPGVDRASLDALLIKLHKKKGSKLTLLRLDNPKEVTPAVRDAQVLFKGEPMHALWVHA